MVISKRLQQIADMVTPGHIPADIGTDHAYVPIHLLLEQKAGKAYAMDIGAGPLDRAREHIRAEGLVEKIEVRQSDGLKELKPGEADTVIIAGMGGALTVRILTDGMHVLERVRELVLSPHSEIEKVREWVLTHGFEITDEEMLIDDGKFYTVLRAERTGIPGEPAQGEIAFGEGTQGDIRKSGIPQDGIPQDGIMQDDIPQDAIMQDDIPQDAISQSENTDLKNEVFLRYGKILIEKRHPVLRQALDREEQLCRTIMSQCPASNTGRIEELRHRLRMIEAARKFMTDEMERGSENVSRYGCPDNQRNGL